MLADFSQFPGEQGDFSFVVLGIDDFLLPQQQLMLNFGRDAWLYSMAAWRGAVLFQQVILNASNATIPVLSGSMHSVLKLLENNWYVFLKALHVNYRFSN